MCTACVQHVYSVCTACVQRVYSVGSACVQRVNSMCTACVQHVYSVCTVCVQRVYSVCTACVQRVYSVCRTAPCYTVLPCSTTPTQLNGHATVCGAGPFSFGSTCQFECDHGYEMPAPAIAMVTCALSLPNSPTPQWDSAPTACVGEVVVTELIFLRGRNKLTYCNCCSITLPWRQYYKKTHYQETRMYIIALNKIVALLWLLNITEKLV